DYFYPGVRSIGELAFFGACQPFLQDDLEDEHFVNGGTAGDGDPGGIAFLRHLYCVMGSLPPALQPEDALGPVRVVKKRGKAKKTWRILDEQKRVLYDSVEAIGVVPETNHTEIVEHADERDASGDSADGETENTDAS
ncbi:unnamed protein product, partial [Amoebophrya sp. A120]